MKDERAEALTRKLRTILSILMIALYVAGLIAMFARNFQLGLYLWVISTVGGIALLYWIKTMDRRREDAEKIASGMPYGDPDDPVEPLRPVVPPEEAEVPAEDDAP